MSAYNHQQVSALKPVCPACLSADTSLKFQVSSEQAAQAFVQVQEQKERNLKLRFHIEQLWDAAACEIRSCAICGFGFAWPFIAGDDTFYNLAYPKVGYPSMKWEFRKTLRALERVDLGAKSVLEVGAGYGFFLDLLREGGMPASNIEAIEYNLDSIDRLRSRGYTAISHDIRSSAFDSRASAFEYIFLFQVVEHMADLDALFSRLRFLLKPEGSIFISVPNVGQIDYQEAHKSLIDMPPNHVGRWTGSAFKAISSRNGLDLIATETEPFEPGLFVRMDLHYSHLRRAQERPAGLSGLARSFPRGKFRRAIETVAVVCGAPGRIPHWISALSDRGRLGQSLWVHLKRSQ